jgi:P2 family phage contractile tail tube protein
MADTRVYRLVRAIINGIPVMGSLDGYTPPPLEKEMEEAKGGRFLADEIMVGMKKGNASLKISGVTPGIIKAMGVSRAESCEITVLGAARDEEGVEVPLRWEHSGEVVSINSDEIKPGKMSHTLEFSCKSYTHTDNSEVLYDIDARTQKCVVGGVDLLEQSRANVELA